MYKWTYAFQTRAVQNSAVLYPVLPSWSLPMHLNINIAQQRNMVTLITPRVSHTCLATTPPLLKMEHPLTSRGIGILKNIF